jgi:hypothetical protein
MFSPRSWMGTCAGSRPGDPGRYIIARRELDWDALLTFNVAIQGMPEVTALLIPDGVSKHGVPRHFLVGGLNGLLQAFTMSGNLVLEHETDSASPITALAEYRHRNESSWSQSDSTCLSGREFVRVLSRGHRTIAINNAVSRGSMEYCSRDTISDSIKTDLEGYREAPLSVFVKAEIG